MTQKNSIYCRDTFFLEARREAKKERSVLNSREAAIDRFGASRRQLGSCLLIVS